jgi:predicted HTH transcriptional regulator
MDLREAKRLIKDGESRSVEFKLKLNHPEKVIREVVAFANTHGGHLFIGVDDDRNIMGSKYADDEDFVMRKAIEELSRPTVTFDSNRFKITEKRTLLHYFIHPGTFKPYFAFEKKQHRYGKAFVRVEDKTIQASPEMRKILKFNSRPYDTHFNYGNNEKTLFNYLTENPHITLPTFRELTGLEYKEASDILVKMVMANTLKLIPRESTDWYRPVE